MNIPAKKCTDPATHGVLSKIAVSPYRQLLTGACVLATVIVVGLIIAAVITVFDDFDYNADAMYLPAFYHDLASGVPIRDWRIPAVAGFFPDMPLMFSILWITVEDIHVSFIIYGVAIVLLLGAAIVYLIGGLVRLRWRIVFLVYAVLFLWITILLVGQDGSFILLFVLIPSFHSGIVISGILFLALAVRLFNNTFPKVLTILLIIISGISIASDAFFLVQFFIPAVICMYVFRRRVIFQEGLTPVRTILICIFSAAAVIIIQRVSRKVFSLGTDAIGTTSVQVTNLIPLFIKIYNFLLPQIKGNPATVLLIIAGFLVVFVIVTRHFLIIYRSRSVDELVSTMKHNYKVYFCFLFFLISGMTSMLFPIISEYTFRAQTSIIRYFQPLYVYPPIIIAVYLSLVLVGESRRIIRSMVITLVLIGCITCVAIRGGDMLPKRFCVNPDLVKYFDALYDDTGVKNGLGSFWLAKPTNLLSERKVHVDAIWYPWGVFPHISNIQWYLVPGPDGKKRLRKYEFIVPYDRHPESHILAEFGLPAMIYENKSIPITPSPGIFEGPYMRAMIYNRKKDVAFRNYLYIPALATMGMEIPSKIQYPKNLQEYKVDGSSPEGKNCSRLSSGEHLRVVFSPPAEGDVLEICADSNDEYEVEVQYTDGRSEKLKVPIQQGDRLGRRILSLDNSERTSCVRAIIISPVVGDGNYAVGHVYVYKDNW